METQSVFSRFLKPSAVMGATPTPRIEHRQEFEETLKGYQPSPETLAILAKTPLVALIAPTATGRNTIINELLKTGHYHFIVSDTTRPRRMNQGKWEQDGVEYFFRSEDEVLDDLKNGRFVEAEFIHQQQVSGISVREIERARAERRIPITDVDIEGGVTIARIKPDATTIYLLPPSFDAWLARINGRSAFAPEELYRRLASVPRHLKTVLENQHFICVVNDDFQQAVKAVDEIATQGIHHRAHENHARQVAAQLYDDTVRYLQTHAPEFLKEG